MVDVSRRLQPSSAPQDHPIHAAAESGDVRRVRAMLDLDPSLVHDVNRAGGHPLHRAVIGRSRDVVRLLLDRSANIHAIHGAGIGSASGYAPQDRQAIDLAIWGGPGQVPTSLIGKIRCVVAMIKWRWWKKRQWNGHAVPCDPRLARLLIDDARTTSPGLNRPADIHCN